MTQTPFPNPFGVFSLLTQPIDRFMGGRAALVEPRIEALPFGVIAYFRVRNDSPQRGQWLASLHAQGLDFNITRQQTGERLDLASDQLSRPQTLTITGLPRGTYRVDLRLENHNTRELDGSVSEEVRVATEQPGTGYQSVQALESSVFFGSARFADGPFVPEGMVLSALVGGRRSGQVNIRSAGTFGIGTNPLLVRNPQVNFGDPVTFFINSFRANETASYQPNGQPQRINLTFPR